MNSLKEYNFSYESFIGGWYIPENICEDIIEYYKKNNHLPVNGFFGNYKSDTSIKNSDDIGVHKDRFDHPFFEYRKNLQNVLLHYLKKYDYCNQLEKFDMNENYNIQHYNINGGFKKWHSERMNKDVSKRVLVFMTYLNDVEDGGTEFSYQKVLCPAKKGLTLIWPAEWTHTHKGQISSTQEKYIVTGWLNFYE
jgi:hypothetical protein